MRNKRPLHSADALATLAARQHGVVSIRQLTGPLGYSRGWVARQVRAARLHPLHRGVYAVGHTRVSRQGACLAAVLACGRGALLSHYSAAWLWGLLTTSPAPHHVTAPSHRKPHPPIRLHHSKTLISEDRVLLERIPVTSVARTHLDLAAVIGDERLARMLERSEELRLFDLRQTEAVISRNRGHAGAGRLDRALALYQPSPIVLRSRLEKRFLRLLLKAGLPRPATNFTIHGYELDVYWPEQRFAVELDVYETHGSRAAFERDRLRQEDLMVAGIEMTRVTDTRLSREPDAVLGRVAQLLARRGSAGYG